MRLNGAAFTSTRLNMRLNGAVFTSIKHNGLHEAKRARTLRSMRLHQFCPARRNRPLCAMAALRMRVLAELLTGDGLRACGCYAGKSPGSPVSLILLSTGVSTHCITFVSHNFEPVPLFDDNRSPESLSDGFVNFTSRQLYLSFLFYCHPHS